MQTLPAIAKAIRESALQLNPRVEGQEVLVPVPRWRPPSWPRRFCRSALHLGVGFCQQL